MDYVECDECGMLIASNLNTGHTHSRDHHYTCSLHPDNIDDAPQYGASSLNEFELPRWYEDSL